MGCLRRKQSCRLPTRILARADQHLADRRFAAPRRPEDARLRADAQLRTLDRLSNLRLDRHLGERNEIWLAQAPVPAEVIAPLPIAEEWTVDDPDSGQPLHPGHAEPARDDRAKGIAMLGGQRLIIHRIGEKRPLSTRFV